MLDLVISTAGRNLAVSERPKSQDSSSRSLVALGTDLGMTGIHFDRSEKSMFQLQGDTFI